MTLYIRLVRLMIHDLDLFALIKHTCYEVRVVSAVVPLLQLIVSLSSHPKLKRNLKILLQF